MIKEILVPLDRSEFAEQALTFALTLASRTEALVTLAAAPKITRNAPPSRRRT